MSKLPRDLSGKELVRILEKAGWTIASRKQRGKGDHIVMEKRGFRAFTIPDHKVIGPGLLRDIVNQAGLSRDEFIKLYGRR